MGKWSSKHDHTAQRQSQNLRVSVWEQGEGGVRKQADRKPSKAASSSETHAVSQNESLNGRWKPRDAGS